MVGGVSNDQIAFSSKVGFSFAPFITKIPHYLCILHYQHVSLNATPVCRASDATSAPSLPFSLDVNV